LSRTLALETAGRTDIGRIRETNQDTLLLRPDLGLFVVADGMGGHVAGELAAAIAVATLEGVYDDLALTQPRAEPSSPSDALALLVAAVHTANSRIQDAAAKNRSKRGMGTTLVAALACGSALCLVHIGDSRIYRLRKREIEQLTDDHTVRNEWIKQGMIVELANKLPLGRRLTRALGTQPTVEVSARLEPVLPGDVLLLCSDGVHGEVPPEELTGILLELGDLSSGVDRLITRANDRGGADNSTAILVRWGL
jgi:serine/threonine protein phosphatase PrpC